MSGQQGGSRSSGANFAPGEVAGGAQEEQTISDRTIAERCLRQRLPVRMADLRDQLLLDKTGAPTPTIAYLANIENRFSYPVKKMGQDLLDHSPALERTEGAFLGASPDSRSGAAGGGTSVPDAAARSPAAPAAPDSRGRSLFIHPWSLLRLSTVARTFNRFREAVLPLKFR